MNVYRQSGAIRRKVIIWLAIPSVLVLSLFGLRAMAHYKFERARAVWKDEALAQTAKTSMTNEEVLTEIDQIKHPTPNLNFGWTHEHVLLMTNGEFLVYSFYHGSNTGFIDHLFLAHGSDGRLVIQHISFLQQHGRCYRR